MPVLILMLAVYGGALGIARAQNQEQAAAADSTDPKVFCPTLKKSIQNVDGLEVYVYQITSLKFLACVPEASKGEDWVVRKSRWSREDQSEWQRFIRTLGESSCKTTEQCLKDPKANSLWSPADAKMLFYSDCADLPYFLRAYFSLKRGLPFSLVSHYKTKELTPEIREQQETSRQELIAKFQEDPEKLKERLANFEKLLSDTRLSWNGNYAVRRYSLPAEQPEPRTFSNVLWKIRDLVSTGTYRMFESPGKIRPDFYSPALDPDSIVPGTVLYKPAGHVAIVYKVSATGAVHYFDAHPDNSISRGQYSRDYTRTNPNKGGGFKNWRPFVLMQAQVDAAGKTIWREAQPDSSGRIQSGVFRYLSDGELTYREDLGGCSHRDSSFPCDYSDEQYRGTEPLPENDYRQARFSVNGRQVDEFDYIRFRLAKGRPVNPVEAFRTDMRALCEDLKGRAQSVQTAIDAHVDRRSHPGVYPANIYGAYGEWEDYSTPGRDLRIRARIGGVVNQARHLLNMIMSDDPTYSYQAPPGADMRSTLTSLKREFFRVYTEVARSCEITYVSSVGREVRLPFEEVLSRVSKMSFDPYMCIERRWGASSREELRSCQDDETKRQWYQLTQFLRNRTERDSAEVMGYRLSDLEQLNSEQKLDNRVAVERFNLRRLLQELLDSSDEGFDGFDPLQAGAPTLPRSRPAEPAEAAAPAVLSEGGRCLGSFCLSARVYHRRTHWEGRITGLNAESQSVTVRFGDSVDAFDSRVSIRDLVPL